MKNELEIAKKIIEKVKWHIERKDYDGLRTYLDEEEKSLINYKSIDEESKYIESLIKDLK